MNLENYKKLIPGKLSKVKELIINELWGEGDSSSHHYVKSSRLLKVTKQKYFDRRIRELKDEQGCDIEVGREAGEHAYKLNSTEFLECHPRKYLTESQKKKLFKKSQYRCAICGSEEEPGIQGLQADHKIPLIRGGSHEDGNWQSLCVTCNVIKRRNCAGCNAKCSECPWAFPAKQGSRVLVTLNSKDFMKLKDISGGDSDKISKLVQDAIEKHLGSAK